MIIVFIIISIGLLVYDILLINKKTLKKEMYVYLGLMTLSITFGVWYFANDYRQTFADYIINLIGG